jgi:nitrite reductase/ring-hydroxylating ferredoxin subunit
MAQRLGGTAASSGGRRSFDVGHVDEFAVGRGRIVDVGGRSVAVFNSDGTLYAVQNLCPHALAPIGYGVLTGTFLPSKPGEDFEYGLEGLVLRCVNHGWEFDIRTGETVCGIDRRRLVTFPVVLDGDRVKVTLKVRSRRDSAAGGD